MRWALLLKRLPKSEIGLPVFCVLIRMVAPGALRFQGIESQSTQKDAASGSFQAVSRRQRAAVAF